MARFFVIHASHVMHTRLYSVIHVHREKVRCICPEHLPFWMFEFVRLKLRENACTLAIYAFGLFACIATILVFSHESLNYEDSPSQPQPDSAIARSFQVVESYILCMFFLWFNKDCN